MPKPNANMTLTEMRSYIRTHKLNHPEVKLGMKRAQLIAGLKKAGHWQEVSKQKRTREKQKGTLSIGQKPKTSARVNTGNIAKGKVLKSKPKRAKAGTTTAGLQDMGMDISKMIGKAVSQNYLLGATRSFPKFEELIEDHDPFMEERGDREDNIREQYSYGPDFARLVKKVSKRRNIDYDDLTEDQQERYFEIMDQQAGKDHRVFIKELWTKHIKGKKFASTKVLIDFFMKKYEDSD